MREPRKPCDGKFTNGPNKRYARCTRCRVVDFEANENERCTRTVEVQDRA